MFLVGPVVRLCWSLKRFQSENIENRFIFLKILWFCEQVIFSCCTLLCVIKKAKHYNSGNQRVAHRLVKRNNWRFVAFYDTVIWLYGILSHMYSTTGLYYGSLQITTRKCYNLVSSGCAITDDVSKSFSMSNGFAYELIQYRIKF